MAAAVPQPGSAFLVIIWFLFIPGHSTPGPGTRANVPEGGTDLPHDTTTTGEVDVGGSVTGNVERNSDRDWFAVDLGAGKRYQFDLEGADTGRGTLEDPRLRNIYDASGSSIPNTENDDVGGSILNSRVIFTPTATGTYYVEATDASSTGTGTYTLSVIELGANGASEADTDFPSVSTISGRVEVGASATGDISTTDDEDWFRVDLSSWRPGATGWRRSSGAPARSRGTMTSRSWRTPMHRRGRCSTASNGCSRRGTRPGRARWRRLRERIGQTRRQIAGLEAQADAAARQRGFIGRELDAQRSLFEKGLTELGRLLRLEREAARLDGQAGDIVARIAGARGRIAEIEIAILQLGAQRVEQAEGEAREAQARENEVRERLAAVRRRLESMEVRAPVAGEVHGMRVFALGEVVRPGEPILNIVPEGAELKVMARLEPIHVDQVHPGQEAVLRFSAFPARTTPEYAGRVARVSANARHDERSGLSWYEVELVPGAAIEPDGQTGIGAWPGRAARMAAGWLPEGAREWLRRNGPDPVGDRPAERPAASVAPVHARDLALTPGMPVEVHLRTGERSPLSYLAKPLTDYFSRSLREE